MHPDISKDYSAAEFRQVSEAYETMSRFFLTKHRLDCLPSSPSGGEEKANDWAVDEDDYLYE